VLDKSVTAATGDIDKLLMQTCTSLSSKVNFLVEKLSISKSESKNSPRYVDKEVVSLSDTLAGRFWTADLLDDEHSPNLRNRKRAIEEIYSIHYLSLIQRNKRSRPFISMEEASQISLLPPSPRDSNIHNTDSSVGEAIDIGDLNLQDLLEFSSRKYPRSHAYRPIHKTWSSIAFLGSKRPSKRKLSIAASR
jgi:hypothetical protein